MNYRILFSVLTVFMLFQTSNVFAWSFKGHVIVCEIAWDHLTDRSKSVLKNDFYVSGRKEFSEDCLWADKIKSSKHPEHKKSTSNHHYLNVPTNANSVVYKRDCDEDCVIFAILEDFALLKNPKASMSEKTDAIKFIGHFMGDLHQPLHISFKEDLGGNRLMGKFFGKYTSMHKLWDSGLLGMMANNKKYPINSRLKNIRVRNSKITDLESSLIQFSNESLEITLAKSTKYEGRKYFGVGKAYLQKNGDIVLMRLKQAGVRLATVLNSIL